MSVVDWSLVVTLLQRSIIRQTLRETLSFKEKFRIVKKERNKMKVIASQFSTVRDSASLSRLSSEKKNDRRNTAKTYFLGAGDLRYCTNLTGKL